ncbi:hypothetical protein EMIT0P291_160130 [Pseudomonas sp. IT-P291]
MPNIIVSLHREQARSYKGQPDTEQKQE